MVSELFLYTQLDYVSALRVPPNYGDALDQKTGARTLKLQSTGWAAKTHTIGFCGEKWAYSSFQQA
jgi:hypothetical protein